MKWSDPVSLQIHIDVISSNKKEEPLMRVFKQLLESCRDIIMDYIDINQKSVLGSLFGFPFALYMDPPDGMVLEPNRQIVSIQKIDRFTQILDYLDGDLVAGCRIFGEDNKTRQLFPAKPTDWGKRYISIFDKKNDTMEISKRRNEVYDLINCYNPELTGISLPLGKLKSLDSFDVVYILRKVDGISEQYELEDDIGERILYHHELSLVIPRYMLKTSEEIRTLQNIWTKCITTVAANYPVCRASMDLDIPTRFTWNERWHLDHSEICNHFAKHLCGYPWGMLITPAQKNLLDKETLIEVQKEYEKVTVLDNGALFLQLSANVDDVASEKYSRARGLFKPYLHSGLVGDEEYPITLRAGCAPEDLVFDKASWSYYIRT